MSNKPLTHEEFSRKGAAATNSKYPKEVRSEWNKKGPQALIEKYGPDYFKKMAQKREENRRNKRKLDT